MWLILPTVLSMLLTLTYSAIPQCCCIKSRNLSGLITRYECKVVSRQTDGSRQNCGQRSYIHTQARAHTAHSSQPLDGRSLFLRSCGNAIKN